MHLLAIQVDTGSIRAASGMKMNKVTVDACEPYGFINSGRELFWVKVACTWDSKPLPELLRHLKALLEAKVAIDKLIVLLI